MNIPLSPQLLVTMLQQTPPELLALILLLCCGVVILGLLRFFGKVGLMVYSSLAVIIANIQVQTAHTFLFFKEPVAQGTIVFSSIFIVSNILTEIYGKRAANKSVWLSFTAMLVVTLFMLLTLGFHPAEGFQESHKAMHTLFIPTPALITASLIAYAVGQFNDIWIFAALSHLTQKSLLWMRTVVATLVGGFLDTVVFSVLAWMVFSPSPLPWRTVLYTYILGTFVLRIGVALLGVPFTYLARITVRHD